MKLRAAWLVISALSVTGLALALFSAQEELKQLPDYTGMDHHFATTEGFYHYQSSLQGWQTQIQSGTTGYLFSDDIFAFDYGGSIGVQHNPLSIAQFVLSLIPHRFEPATKSVIVDHLDFLLEGAELSKQGNLLLSFGYDFPSTGQTTPWYSAMAQGQAASAFLWGYRLTSDRRYREAAWRLVLAMAEEGNLFARELESGVWLKEYPGYEAQVLDGSLAAVAGVYDVLREIPVTLPKKREQVTRLLNAALVGLKKNAACFENPLSGHYFDDSGTIPEVSYYQANLAWLGYLIRADPELEAVRENLRAKPMEYWHRFAEAVLYVMNKQRRKLGMARPCVD